WRLSILSQDMPGNLRKVLALPANQHHSLAKKNFFQHGFEVRPLKVIVNLDGQFVSQRCNCLGSAFAALAFQELGCKQDLRSGQSGMLKMAVAGSKQGR